MLSGSTAATGGFPGWATRQVQALDCRAGMPLFSVPGSQAAGAPAAASCRIGSGPVVGVVGRPASSAPIPTAERSEASILALRRVPGVGERGRVVSALGKAIAAGALNTRAELTAPIRPPGRVLR
jgi:hypothetical protein